MEKIGFPFSKKNDNSVSASFTMAGTKTRRGSAVHVDMVDGRLGGTRMVPVDSRDCAPGRPGGRATAAGRGSARRIEWSRG
jgi:hypothetical protein